MPLQAVEVCVPDGVSAGQEFDIELDGMQFTVSCPSGCGPGDAIVIEVDSPAGPSAGAPQQVEITIPDGCFPGDQFSVQLGDHTFDVAVPDGCLPGQALLIAVPDDGGETGAADNNAETRDADLARQLQEENPGTWACAACTFLNSEPRTVCDVCGTARSTGNAEDDPATRSAQEQEDAELARRLQGAELRESSNVSNVTGGGGFGGGGGTGLGGGGYSGSSSTAAPPEQPTSLFATSVGTDDGTFGKACGDFHVGQLVQVTRSDGSWTYGKVISYDEGGDNYSVMTKAGPKHFVERDDITAETLVNPHGGCAQQ